MYFANYLFTWCWFFKLYRLASADCLTVRCSCDWIDFSQIVLQQTVGESLGPLQGNLLKVKRRCINLHLFIYYGHFQVNLDLAYDSAEEDSFRKAIFAQTDAMIQEHNSDPESTYQMAHNLFSAMVIIRLHLFYNYV